MPVSFDSIRVGENYSRPQLSTIWGYQSHQAISRGIVTPKDSPFVILFATNIKQTGYTQYKNEIRDDLLYTEGETNHSSDNRIIESLNEHVKIHLFYRHKHHTDFTYMGRVFLVSHEIMISEPSKFVYAMSEYSKKGFDSIQTEIDTHGMIDQDFVPETEGEKKLALHYTYERSIKNRGKAIEIHGSVCAVCGFDFNKIYGIEWAQSYIEVHHTRSVTSLNNSIVDPSKDLIPLCSNCHSMAHRRRDTILSIAELKALVDISNSNIEQ